MGKKSKGMSLRARILISGVILLCVLIIGACAIIGFQVYQINVKQYEQTTSQQFSLIKQNILLFMQNNKSMVKMIAEHPTVRAADETINSYVSAKQDVIVKNTQKSSTEQAMVTIPILRRYISDQNGAAMQLHGTTVCKPVMILGPVHGTGWQNPPTAIRL